MTRIERVTIFKNALFILSFTALMISTGCRRMTPAISSTDYSADSSVISNSGETDTVSIFEEMNSSELSAPSALSSETVSEVNSKPAATQNQETDSENSVSVSKSSDGSVSKEPSFGNVDSSQTSNNSESEYIPVKKATAADTREVADKVIFYLNKARAEIGSGELSKLSGLTRYAEFRSGQLISNFAHDPGDWNKAAEATGYGKYIDLSEYGNAEGYYEIGAMEAIAMAGLVGSTDKIAETLAQIIIDSPRHWAYVGLAEMKYTGVGVSCDANMWYAAIMVTNTTDYEN